jgi:hypothetical protein
MRSVDNRLFERLALFKLMADVFGREGRVVDESPDREREAAERHDVDRLTERGKRQDQILLASTTNVWGAAARDDGAPSIPMTSADE